MAKGYTRSICSRFIVMTIPASGREGREGARIYFSIIENALRTPLRFTNRYRPILLLVFSKYANFRYCKLDIVNEFEAEREREEEFLCLGRLDGDFENRGRGED